MILVAGSANLDFVVRAHHIPAPGETVLGRDFKTFPGGKGANQAVACARAGGVVTHMLAAFGNDDFAKPIQESLTQAGVQLTAVNCPDQPTGTAFICVSEEAENAITVAPGANDALLPGHLPTLQGFTHLLLQLETPMPTVIAFAQAARAQSVKVVLNAAPAKALPQALLQSIDVLVVNEGELAAIAGHAGSIAQDLERIQAPTVVVTLGHHGCMARHEGHTYFQPAFPVTPVDTTAAGDTFCGTLAAALSKGENMQSALALASAAGALACTRLGAQTSIPFANEVGALVASHPSHDTAKLSALRAFCGLS
jgi:ribokinase